jgi:hypothetical protein
MLVSWTRLFSQQRPLSWITSIPLANGSLSLRCQEAQKWRLNITLRPGGGNNI